MQVSGENIKTIRNLQGISQTGLAMAVGLSQVAISRFERGTLKLSDDKLKRICEALEIPMDKKDA
jgi:transcriptional regulator with XRE-family HTH domain